MGDTRDNRDKELFPYSVSNALKCSVLVHYQPMYDRHCVQCGAIVKFQVLSKERECPARHPVEFRELSQYEKCVYMMGAWGRCVHCDNFLAAHHRFCSCCGRKNYKYDPAKNDRLQASTMNSVRCKVKIELDKALSEHGLQTYLDSKNGFIVRKIGEDSKDGKTTKFSGSSSKIVASLRKCVPGLRSTASTTNSTVNTSTPVSAKDNSVFTTTSSLSTPILKNDGVTESDEEFLALTTFDETPSAIMESSAMSMTSSMPNVSTVSAASAVLPNDESSVHHSVEDMSWKDCSRSSKPSTSTNFDTSSRTLRTRQGYRRHYDHDSANDSVSGSKSEEPVVKKNRKTRKDPAGNGGNRDDLMQNNCVDLADSDEEDKVASEGNK